MSQNQGPSLLAVVNAVLRRRYTVLTIVMFCLTIAVAKVLIAGRSYTAVASFVAQNGRPQSTIAGLAAQVGLVMPSAEPARSPQFYADLLRTDEILGHAVTDSYKVYDGLANTTLTRLYAGRIRDAARARLKAIRVLRRNLVISVAQRTGIVELKVTARSPLLAQQIAQRLLKLLDDFNQQTRQSQASAERRFTERRVAETRLDLHRAEERLREFLQRNRQYRGSPELSLEFDRFERDVSMRQELYTSMTQAFEQARIDELRDTPVLTIIQNVEPPARPDSWVTLRILVVGLLLGIVLGLVAAILREHITRSASTRIDELAELSALRTAALQDLRRPLSLLRRTPAQ